MLIYVSRPVAVTLSLAKVANTLSKHKVLCKWVALIHSLANGLTRLQVSIHCRDAWIGQRFVFGEQLVVLNLSGI